MIKAWIENNIVRGVSADSYSLHHPEVAVLFTMDVPDDTLPGMIYADGKFTKPITTTGYPKLTPMQFKMCFTSTERIAIKALKATDPIIEDAFDLLDDPRLTEVNMGLKSNQDLIDYLVSLTILTTERAAQIKLGVQL